MMRWFLLATAKVVFTMISFFIVPIAVLFASADGWLPRWLWWLQTDDCSLRGDYGWQTEHWQWRFRLPLWLAEYVGRVGWLWRNPGYAFAKEVCGFRVLQGFAYVVIGDERTGNLPLKEGEVFRYILNPDGTYAWQWYYVKAWPGKTKCLRINLGWKLWGNKKAGDTCRLVCSISPWQLCRLSPAP